MDSQNNSYLDDFLSSSSNKRTIDEIEQEQALQQGQSIVDTTNPDVASTSKRMKLEDDPLNSVFADLPNLDASLEMTMDSLDPSIAGSPAVSQQTPTVSTPADPKLMSRNPSIGNVLLLNAKPKKITKAALKKEQKALAAAAAAAASASNTGTKSSSLTNGPPKEKTDDPDRMSDAVLAAGIDLKAEESLLLIANQSKIVTSSNQTGMSLQKLMDLKQFGGFMNKVIKENALTQLNVSKTEIVELVQLACEHFMKDIITNSVIYSRHRRRPIKSKTKSSSTQRSDISRALRDLAVKDKELEEKRVKKRAALGMDTGEDKTEKAGVEETLHRAANATAAMMMAGPKKKKYSWMTGSSNGGAGGAGDSNGTSSAVAARGDTGIRYREAREEPGIVLRDFVAALETKRMGVDRTLTKAYARL